MRFAVVYDACVLYPAPVRDLLMRLALQDLFAAKWSAQIHREWKNGILRNRPELASKLERTQALMDKAIPDALTTGHEALIEALELPDPDDRHVLAVAIKSGAQLIVTFNLKDFPEKALHTYGIEAVHPDDFIIQQFDLNPGKVLEAAKNQKDSLRNPTMTFKEYLAALEKTGLLATADQLKEYGYLFG